MEATYNTRSYNASGDTSPRVFRSAALYALYSDCASSPYSDCGSMLSCLMKLLARTSKQELLHIHRSNDEPNCEELDMMREQEVKSTTGFQDDILLGVLGSLQVAPLCKM